jgi:parvulin-like peptidyl-prolyl isomerase
MRPGLLLFGLALLAAVAAAAGQKPAAKKAPPKPKPAAPAAGAPLPTRRPPGDVLATVNGDPLTAGDYLDELALKWGPDAFDLLFDAALVRQEAKRRSITAAEGDINQALEALVHANAASYGGMPTLQQAVQERGWTMAEYRALIRRDATLNVLREKIRQALSADIKITNEEIEAEYRRQELVFHLPDQVEIRHILIRRNPAGDEQMNAGARTRAQQALQRLRAAGGANFAEVAAQVSEDRNTAKTGGKLPAPLRRDNQPLGPDFDALFEAPPGLVGRVLESPAGFHVVWVEKRIPARVVPLAEVKEPLRRALFEQKSQARAAALWDTLRRDAKVERRLKY